MFPVPIFSIATTAVELRTDELEERLEQLTTCKLETGGTDLTHTAAKPLVADRTLWLVGLSILTTFPVGDHADSAQHQVS